MNNRLKYLRTFTILVLALYSGYVCAQSDVKIELITQHPLNIIIPGEEDEIYLKLHNAGESFEAGWLDLSIRGYNNSEISLYREIQLNPGDSVVLEVPDQIFNRKGIHWLEYRYINTGQDTLRGRNSFAYMIPIGNDYEQDRNSFKFGIAGIRDYSPESFELQLKAAQLIGAAYERKYASWGQIQPEPGTWNWQALDYEIETAEKYGLERQLLINGGARWAVRDKYKDHPKKGNTPPRLDPWAEYVYQLANRYKDRITYYEIWNEPDIGFYHGTIDEYLDILKTAYRQIKKVDKDLQVMSGGFASAIPRPRYLEERGDLHREVVKRGQRYFDIHAFHRHSPFNRFRNEVEGPLAEIRSLLKEPKPIWFNETAMHSTFIGEKEQARVLFKKLTYGWARGAMGYTWFNMLSNPNYPPSHHEHNYGMLRENFNPKAVYVTYNLLVTHLHDKQFVRQLETPDGYYCFLYENDNEKLIAGWKEDESKPDLLYMPFSPGVTQVTEADIMGNDRHLEPVNGRFPLLINQSCKLYILEGGGNLQWTEAVLMPEVEADINEFSLSIQQDEEVKGLSTQLIYPEMPERMEKTYRVKDHNLPSYFEAKLQYSIPENNWFGIMDIPVRLLTAVSSKDWQTRKADFTLSSAEQVTNRFEHDPATTHLTWQGPEDISADGWFQYEEDQLIITLKVMDDYFVKSNKDEQGDFIHLMLYLTEQDKILSYRLNPQKNEELEIIYKDDEAYSAEAELLKKDNKTVYQLRVPVTKEQLQAGVGYNLQIHDNDSKEVEGYIQLAPGMGVVDEPHYFPVMKLKTEKEN